MQALIKISKFTAIAFILAGINFQIQAEWSSLSTDERLIRLERVLQTQTATIEKLRNELQELRGKLELQGNAIESITADRNSPAIDETKTTSITPDQPEIATKHPVVAEPAVVEEESGASPLVPPDAVPDKNNQPVDNSTDVVTEEPVASAESEIDTYNKAFEQLKAGQYADAIKGFRAQLIAYPHGQYAGNAQYWLGETYYVTRDFDSALLAFNQVLEQYPKSNKVAGATLKLGFIYHERGQSAKAIELLQQVVATYPNSTEAKLAQQRLGLLVR